MFAHGTLPEYRAALASGAALPPLSPAQELKLKKLTVATMAERAQTLRYDDLMAALEVPAVRELEDFLINECISPGLARGKLDQRRACFEVHQAIGRDIRPGQLPELIATLDAWRENAERALRDVEAKVRWANDAQAKASRRKDEVDAEVAATIRTIKAEAEEAGRSAVAATATEEGMDFEEDAARTESDPNEDGDAETTRSASARENWACVWNVTLRTTFGRRVRSRFNLRAAGLMGPRRFNCGAVDSRDLHDHFPPRASRLEPLERPRDTRLVEVPFRVNHGRRFSPQRLDDLRELRAVLSGEYEPIVVALPSGQRADPLPRAAVDGDASTPGRDRLATQVHVVLPAPLPVAAS